MRERKRNFFHSNGLLTWVIALGIESRSDGVVGQPAWCKLYVQLTPDHYRQRDRAFYVQVCGRAVEVSWNWPRWFTGSTTTTRIHRRPNNA